VVNTTAHQTGGESGRAVPSGHFADHRLPRVRRQLLLNLALVIAGSAKLLEIGSRRPNEGVLCFGVRNRLESRTLQALRFLHVVSP
jgi:hypothetical protein